MFIIRRVVGHSMVPALPPKTLVIGLRSYRRLEPGDIVIIEHDKKEKIKRIDQVKDKQLYVLGDHSETSTDSRHFGWIDQTNVRARVIWPRPKTD